MFRCDAFFSMNEALYSVIDRKLVREKVFGLDGKDNTQDC